MVDAIRRAMRADLAAVEAVVEAAYTPFVAVIGRKPGPMLDDYAAHIDEGRVHVIERDNMVKAILVLIPQGEAMLLDNVAVAPDAQGSGLGRRLLAFAEAEARDIGCRSMRLYTNQAMTENIALYGRIGYVETHRVVEKGLNRVYMAKRLD